MRSSLRLPVALAVVAVLGIAVVGLPALAVAPPSAPSDRAALAAPSPSPTLIASYQPKRVRVHVPAEPIELRGAIRAIADKDGRPAYELVDTDGAAWQLEVGPPWWWGTSNPLAAYVGQTVTVTGERHPGEREVDVFTVDGKTVREAGKPPWAGGWKAVGERHPGWSQAKADRWEAKRAARLARCTGDNPPGYCKHLRVPTTP